MPTTIHFMFNMQPHYQRLIFDGSYEAITVKIILDEAHKAHKSAHALSGEPEAQREKFQLRYITHEAEAFSIAGLADHDDILEMACDWYRKRGHRLLSTCIGPDESALLESVVPKPDSQVVVRLYAIVAPDVIPVLSDAQAPPLLANEIYIEQSQALLASSEGTSLSEKDAENSFPDDSCPQPNFGPWATIYEPVFAYANVAFEVFLPIYPEVRALDEDLEVIDGKAFNIRICVYDLGKALKDVKYRWDSTHVETLKGLLRDLFGDPTLQVNVKQVREDGHLFTELEIIGECHTAHGLPAPYIMGKDKLTPDSSQNREGEGFGAYKCAVVGPKYTAVREMSCCPCLLITMHGYSINIYVAIPLLLRDPSWRDGTPGEYSNTFKFQVIRKTAQELRKAYAAIYTGSALPNAPHLLLQVKNLTRPRLPMPLHLVDRVRPSAGSSSATMWARPPLLFTGFLTRPEDGTPAPVHVKFTSDVSYGVDAHRLLAMHELDLGSDSGSGDEDADEDEDEDEDEDSRLGPTPWPLAPAFMHRVLFPGTHTRMVVMRTLEGDTLEHLLASGETVSEADLADLADVHTAVAVLHRNGFVHGDIRPSNVLVQRDYDDDADNGETCTYTPCRAYLLGFDWAGKVGKVRYPYTLSDSGHVRLPRPACEMRGRLITKRDDRFMLRNLLTGRRAPKKKEEEEGKGEDAGAGASLGKQKQIDVDDNDSNEDAEEDSGEEDQDTAVLSDPDDDDPKQDDSPWSSILTREKVEDFGIAWEAYGAVYPLDINPKIKWPRPAEELRGQPITKAHDNFMLEELLNELGSEEEDTETEDADGRKRKLEEGDSTSASREVDRPKKRKQNDDDEDEDEDDNEDDDEDDDEDEDEDEDKNKDEDEEEEIMTLG
ncbi:hypothetical protein V8D89_000410 [Ganoderma adspersum]